MRTLFTRQHWRESMDFYDGLILGNIIASSAIAITNGGVGWFTALLWACIFVGRQAWLATRQHGRGE